MRHITRHLCTTGLIAISTIRTMNRPGIAPGGASKKGDNCGSVILLVVFTEQFFVYKNVLGKDEIN
jgi:hypothetical protein